MNAVNHILLQLNAIEKRCNGNYGLYHGKTGLALVYYILYAATGDVSYQVKAKSLIDELSDNIASVGLLDFENGLAGIGWAIEWLVQNKFIDADTDEILEDIDDELYKSVVYMKSPDLTITRGAIGKALYFYKRLSARNAHTSRYRNICTRECAVLLIDEINDALIDENYTIIYKNGLSNQHARLVEIGQSLLFLAAVNYLNLNTEVAKRIICAILKFLNQYFLSNEFIQNDDEGDKLYLVYSCYKAGEYLKDDDLISKANDAYHLYNEHYSDKIEYGQFRIFIDEKLSHLLSTPLKGNDLEFSNSRYSVFSVLRSVSFLPGASAYAWGEAWGV